MDNGRMIDDNITSNDTKRNIANQPTYISKQPTKIQAIKKNINNSDNQIKNVMDKVDEDKVNEDKVDENKVDENKINKYHWDNDNWKKNYWRRNNYWKEKYYDNLRYINNNWYYYPLYPYLYPYTRYFITDNSGDLYDDNFYNAYYAFLLDEYIKLRIKLQDMNNTLNELQKKNLAEEINEDVKEETGELSTNEEKIENLKSLINNLEEYINEKKVVETFDIEHNNLNSEWIYIIIILVILCLFICK